MNDFDSQHAPRAEFRASLEEQIARELRRARQFEPFVRASRRRRFATVVGLTMGAVVTLTIGLVLGVSTGYASAEVLHARANHDTTSPSQPALTILRNIPVRTAITAVSCAAASLSAESRPAQQGIPIVDLATTVRSSELFGAILGLHQSPDGKVLVDDAGHRQLKLFDSTLASASVVLDSMPGASNSYGPAMTALLPYVGDSSLFMDWNAQTLIVLDGHGQVGHALALPSTRELRSVGNVSTGVDRKGRLVFRAMRNPIAAPQNSIAYGDSIAVVRTDLDLRRTDTIARIARPLMKVTTEKFSDGSTGRIFALDPLQAVDEWAVLSNGAVAIVRGHDYHIDWIEPDGSLVSTPKLPFDWKRLTDDEKQHLADSVRATQNGMLAIGYPTAEVRTRSPVPCDGGRGGAGDGGGRGAGATGRSGGSGGPPPPDATCMERLSGAGRGPLPPLPFLADLTRDGSIADYDPPLVPSGTVADRDGNLWILPRATKLSQHGELVYDVVNAKGELFERVRLPASRAIAGFGRGGVVYLTSGDRTTGFYLERGKLSAPVTTQPKK